MKTSMPIIAEGGLASITAGLLLIFGHSLNLWLGGANHLSPGGQILVLFAHMIMIMGFFSWWSTGLIQPNFWGRLGIWLSILGSVIVVAIVLLEIAGLSGIDLVGIETAPYVQDVYLLGPLAFLFGLVILSFNLINHPQLPVNVGGWILLAGNIIFALSTVLSQHQGAVALLGAILTGGAFVWIGRQERNYKQPLAL